MAESEKVIEQVEHAAAEQLGVERRDRIEIYRESATSATDADLPYWIVLLVAGAIAMLGMAINSAAVVIGAMLIAPLLAPIMGLALGLAIGDTRLALQTAAVVLVSMLAVIATGAVLTLLLPFQTLTPEIAARTRPTTLDLAIAVFSGLAGAVVTVSRGKRLSGAIPGVALAVALIPPLAVTGFGLGTRDAEIVRGSLLLYGANLAGIVLSGVAVFILVGMYAPDVHEAADRWHDEARPTGLARMVDRIGWVSRAVTIRSAWARVGLVVAFVAVVWVPLAEMLDTIVREARVGSAVRQAEARFEEPGRSFVINRQVVLGEGATDVVLRVATTERFDDQARADFERAATAAAHEPVRLVLEQIPANVWDLDQLADLSTRAAAVESATPAAATFPALAEQLGARAEQAAAALPLPDGVQHAGTEVAIGSQGAVTLRVAYLAAEPLPPEAEAILARQLGDSLGEPRLAVRFDAIPAAPRPLASAAVSAALDAAVETLLRYPALAVELLVGPDADRAAARSASDRITRRGVAAERVAARPDGAPGLRLRLLRR